MNIVTVSSLFFTIYFFGINIIAIYISTAVLSLTSSFIRTAFTSSISNLFSQENIQIVLGFNQSTLSLAGILGPVIGGVIYGFFGQEILLLCFIVGYSVSTILDSTMNFKLYTKKGEIENKNKRISMKESITSGLKYSFGNKVIASLISIAVFANFFGSALIVGLSKVLIDHFQMEAHYVGSMESSIAIGTLIGGILIGIRKNFQNPLKASKRGLIIIGIIILGMSSPFLLGMNTLQVLLTYGLLLLIFGIVSQFANTPMLVFLQNNVDVNYRGRVFSLIEMNAMLLTPISYIIFGLLFDMELYKWIFISSGILTIMAVFCILRPSVINMNSLEEKNEGHTDGKSINLTSFGTADEKDMDVKTKIECLEEKITALHKEIQNMKNRA